ncbi:MAG: NAD(P)H-dependent glycerol-3-phosphate dehydrogenase [Rhodoferax sp.]
MKIVVLGAGAWGTALGAAAARQHPQRTVLLWARDPQQAQQMQAQRVNARYLPGLALPEGLHIAGGMEPQALVREQAPDLVVIATPMAALRSMLQALRDCGRATLWLCKGFEAAQPGGGYGLLGHEVQQAVAPGLPCGVLSGPSFAQEVAQAQPTALVAASADAQVRQLAVQALHGGHLRVYANDDIIGVEVGGAVKNVLALATGLCDGLALGMNARAALITRGLAEMNRLGLALGARTDTFMGLSGLGDLVLTATGDLSRNRRVGLALAAGASLADATAALGHVAEGVYSARTVAQRARSLGVAMPITEAVVDLLDGRLQPLQAVQRLMARDPAFEAGNGS